MSSSPTSTLRLLPSSKRKMSLTQTYFLAHTARGKLSSEAARADHNLRLLVCHANLLDSLMLDLADAEAEQESWFNNSVQNATAVSKPAHIQWADAIVEEEEEEDWASESSDSDSDEEDVAPLRRISSHTTQRYTSAEQMSEDEEEYEDDGEEDYAMLTLTRTHSHSASPPTPELSHDDSDESEDDTMPPSPPTDTLPVFPAKTQVVKDKLFESAFYNRSLVTAVSVY